MQRKYIHYERPDIAGLYYREGNVYFENLDSKNGKIVRIIFPGQGRCLLYTSPSPRDCS